MATTASAASRPIPKPRTIIPSGPEQKILFPTKSCSKKPIPPPKPVGLNLYAGQVKFRNPPLPSWSPPSSSSSPSTTTKTISASAAATDKSSSKNSDKKFLSPNGKMTTKIETKEEKKAAAEKIVNSLKDGVEALNEVLNNFEENSNNNDINNENEDDETEINNKRLTVIEVVKREEEEPNYVNIDAIYKKPDIEDKTMVYLMTGEVVTESEIISCIENLDEDKTEVNDTSSEDDETTKFSELSLEINDDSKTQIWLHQNSHPQTHEPLNNQGGNEKVIIEKESEKQQSSSSSSSLSPAFIDADCENSKEKEEEKQPTKSSVSKNDSIDSTITGSKDCSCSKDSENIENIEKVEKTEESNNSKMAFREIQAQHRRAVAQVPPQAARPKPIERRKNQAPTTLRRLEDCVPPEYTSSPIVQILAAAEERPEPPRTLDDLSRSLAAMSTSSTSFPQNSGNKFSNSSNNPQTFLMTNSCMPEVSPGSSSASSGVSSSSDLQRPPPQQQPPQPKIHEVQIRRIQTRPQPKRSSITGLPRMGISSSYPLQTTTPTSTLERIIRTHPIWYLPHLGRAAANHLLRPMPSGSFIVRVSTRPSSMALTIKLPPTYGTDTDHYLLERLGPSTVKLEGSPHIFRSLPLLIEYYCQTADELQCKLTLPPAIQMCSNTIDLQRIALMGQDFWTSELARSGGAESMPYRRQTSQPVMPVSRISRTSENEQTNKRLSQRIGSPVYPLRNHLSDQLQVEPPLQKPSAKPRKTLPTMNSMLLKKSQSENEGLQKDNISQASTTESSTSKSSKPSKHFFRNLFSSSSNSIQPSTSSSSPNSSSRFYDGYTDSSAQQYSAYGYIPPRDPSSSKDQHPSEPSSTSTSTTSSLRRSFAKFKSFNKSSSSSRSKSKESKDDGAFNKLSADAIKARQAAFRREQTDISAASVYRLATHRNNTQSPTNQMFNGNSSNSSFSNKTNKNPPPLIPSKKILDENAMQKCIDELRLKRMTSKNSQKSTPLPATVSPKPTRDTSEIFKEFDGFIQNNGKPYEVILRNKKANQSRKPFQDRLSVPNLSEDSVILAQQQNQNGTTFEPKFGRAPDTGELQTINEGLITPVIRRKQFAALNGPSPENYTNAEYFERRNGKIAMDFEAKNDEKEQQSLQKQAAPAVPQKPLKQQQPTAAPSTARSQYSIVGTTSSSTSDSSTTPTSTKPIKKIGPQSLLNWSEINSEIKTRQRIAKVRPTPQPIPARSPSNSMMSSSKISSSPTAEPPAKKQSEYAQLSEISDIYDPDTSIGSYHSTITSHSSQQQQQHSSQSHFPSNSETYDDDAISVAGTVFNEPWDSNAWENLLDLAKYGDEKSNIRTCTNNFYHNSTATIEEEDSLPLEVDDVVISCVDSDSDEQPLASPESVEIIQECDDKMEESADSLASLKGSKRDVFSVENNRIWAEFSNRIPSEPSSKASTFDPRKQIRSNSMLNVARAGDVATLTRRALTPSNSSASAQMSPSQLRLRSASARPPISDPGTRIQQYIESLAKNSNTVFGATLRRFIECTIEAEESDPSIQIRNVRQFLNGIKNYLVKHGEADLHAMIEAESGNLNANEFLNIDAILEAVLHKILLVPVKNHLYHLMVKEHSRNGSLQALSENLLKVRSMKPSELGFPDGTVLPDFKELESIKQCLRRMQNHYSPLKKLENLLRALTIVILPNRNLNNNNIEYSPTKKYSLIQNGTLSGVLGSKKLPPAEELIRWLVYILAKTSTINCEIEAWYMWELLPQQLLTTGDAAYYLTTLFSAVHVLKNPESIRRLGKGFPLSPDPNRCPDDPSDAFISVAIPNEQNGSIEYHTFPAVPQMNAGKLCRVIGHQLAITNPEDYGLYVLFDGFETCLIANECPDAIRDQLYEAGKPHLFAYKRHEAKIAWPKHVINTSSSSSTCSSNISPNGSDVAAFHLRPSHVIQPSPIHKRKHLPVASKIV